jgi:putative ABC transport system permease protein
MLFLRLLKESLFFALDSLIVNKLRTVLSLLGITIGIFAMISVFTLVDSLENNIKSSIQGLGDNVIYVQKWPWSFDSGQPWWDYIRRPVPKQEEFKMIKKLSQTAESVAMIISGSAVLKYESNSVEGGAFIGGSYEYNDIWDLKIEKGRYMTALESQAGRPVAVIGFDIADNLFQGLEPVGRKFKFKGRKIEVIGVLEKEGESMLGNSNDMNVFMPLNFTRNLFDMRRESLNATIMAKTKTNVSNTELIDELTGIMRSLRKLKPKEKDNFALNQLSLLSQGFESVFSIVGFAGGVIGIFSIIVGGFSIANIMFVSVRERTSLIGIQKSLGAKNYFILFQFLFESIFLCLIGGLVGLMFIFIGSLAITYGAEFEVILGWNNIVLGLGISITIGVISGIVPAWSASRLDPVEAIRAN